MPFSEVACHYRFITKSFSFSLINILFYRMAPFFRFDFYQIYGFNAETGMI